MLRLYNNYLVQRDFLLLNPTTQRECITEMIINKLLIDSLRVYSFLAIFQPFRDGLRLIMKIPNYFFVLFLRTLYWTPNDKTDWHGIPIHGKFISERPLTFTSNTENHWISQPTLFIRLQRAILKTFHIFIICSEHCWQLFTSSNLYTRTWILNHFGVNCAIRKILRT